MRVFNREMLRLARDLRELTQAELADKSGITQAFISKLQHGLSTLRAMISSTASAGRWDFLVPFSSNAKKFSDCLISISARQQTTGANYGNDEYSSSTYCETFAFI